MAGYKPFKMRGNPFKRNFGIGADSPMQDKGKHPHTEDGSHPGETIYDPTPVKDQNWGADDPYHGQGEHGVDVKHETWGSKKTGSPTKQGYEPGGYKPPKDERGKKKTEHGTGYEPGGYKPPSLSEKEIARLKAKKHRTGYEPKSPARAKVTYEKQLANYNAWVAGGRTGREVVNPDDPKSKAFQEGPGVKKTGSPAKSDPWSGKKPGSYEKHKATTPHHGVDPSRILEIQKELEESGQWAKWSEMDNPNKKTGSPAKHVGEAKHPTEDISAHKGHLSKSSGPTVGYGAAEAVSEWKEKSGPRKTGSPAKKFTLISKAKRQKIKKTIKSKFTKKRGLQCVKGDCPPSSMAKTGSPAKSEHVPGRGGKKPSQVSNRGREKPIRGGDYYSGK